MSTNTVSPSDMISAVLEEEGDLKQYGVPGMRWGRRKDRGGGGSDKNPVEVEVKHIPGKGITGVKGGQNQPASEDAIRKVAVTQLVRASTLSAASNKELQDAVKRMELEQKFVKLTTTPNKGVKAFIKNLLTDTAKTEVAALAQGKNGPLISKLDGILEENNKGGKHRKN